MQLVTLMNGTTSATIRVHNTDKKLSLVLNSHDGFVIEFEIKPEDVQKLCVWKAQKWYAEKGIFETILTKGFDTVIETAILGLQTKKLNVEKKGSAYTASLFLYPEHCAWSSDGVTLESSEPFSLPDQVVSELDAYEEHLREISESED